ncbi:hypothetical protein SAMN05216345_102674 [Cupriavidus sp. YR651]|uniref:integrase n=1 Tax=Cupriavidus sp. YR651 TaxID=1855315 RepID=UPI000885D949|nr:integrase [Cupriavidus sp. YR651]SDC53852.1 hypothetical protein SAMN05216345_102674 [Cupriavidus sp. YR651]
MNVKYKPEKVAPNERSQSIYDLSDDELGDFWVSDCSQVKDLEWFFPNQTPGAKKSSSTLNWGMKLYDGSRLSDPEHAQKLCWAKIAMLTLLKDPEYGAPPAPGSMLAYQQAFKWLLSWMSEMAYFLPSELTPSVVEHYIEDLPRFILDCNEEEVLTISTTSRALDALAVLWQQRKQLKRFGIESLQSDPFFQKGVATVAEDISGQGVGWIPPLPDEVAIPIFNKAFWFVRVPAEDILKLVEAHEVRTGESADVRSKRIRRRILSFNFAHDESNGGRWHKSIADIIPKRASYDFTPTLTVKHLVRNLVGACAILLGGLSGMRISEMCGLEVGIDPKTKLPTNVRIETGASGLYEWFVLKSVEAKGNKGILVEVEWVLGMRLAGSNEIPPAVHVLQLLNRLFSIWRETAGCTKLLLQCCQKNSLAVPGNALAGIPADELRMTMKDFVANWVDLSNLPDESRHKTSDNDLIPWRETKGRILSTYMLRKTWASFTLAVNPRLLRAIQMQFHHLRSAVTEVSYIGSNPLLVESLDSVARQKRNMWIYEMATGQLAASGRMGKQLYEASKHLHAHWTNLPTAERWKRIARWADGNEINFFFADHSTCNPMLRSEMRCQDVAKTPIWLRVRPNFRTREPGLCAGCACAIVDQSHEPFWANRYVQHKVAIWRAEQLGTTGQFKVIQARAEQAKRFLASFGTDLAPLDILVRQQVEGAS